MSKNRLRVVINPKEFLYISNILSLSRIFLLPFIIISLIKNPAPYGLLTVTLMVIAIITDALDGYLARRLNEVSALGKMLDPIGDKLCIGAVGVTVALLNDLPWWAMGFIILRDFLILTGGIIMVEKWTIITSSNIWGKATSFFQAISIMAYAFEVPFRSYPLTVALVFTGVSTISYFTEFIHLVNEETKIHNNKI
ncbi:MAG: CDP-alcohol phosphatidyltransferase family protein [bacterium]